MPSMEGRSLRERLDKERQLPLPEALRIAREVASALDYAHRHNSPRRSLADARNFQPRGGRVRAAY